MEGVQAGRAPPHRLALLEAQFLEPPRDARQVLEGRSGALLGHATIEMTTRYSHLAPVIHRDAVDALDGQSPFPSESEDAIG